MECSENGAVYRVAHSQIIGIDYKKPRICRKTKQMICLTTTRYTVERSHSS